MSQTTEHLKKYGVSFDDAKKFVYDNLGNPALIYEVSIQFGVTSSMLAELYGQGVNAAVVEQFFSAAGFNADLLKPKVVINWDFAQLESDLMNLMVTDANLYQMSLLYRPFDSAGVLSAQNLTARILKDVSKERFNAYMETESMDDNEDGIVTAEEAEAPGMPSFAATVENGAAHTYGFLIRALKGLDQSELNAMKAITSEGLKTGREETLKTLTAFMGAYIDAITTPAQVPLLSDEKVADVIVVGLVSAINSNGDMSQIIFDSVIYDFLS